MVEQTQTRNELARKYFPRSILEHNPQRVRILLGENLIYMCYNQAMIVSKGETVVVKTGVDRLFDDSNGQKRVLRRQLIEAIASQHEAYLDSRRAKA